MFPLRSHLRRSLFAYYFVNPKARLYLRELAAILNVDPTNLSRELTRLEKEGIFRSETRGNQKFFSLNPQYPLRKELFAVLKQTVGIVPTLTESLKAVPGIHHAWLYGSFAKGEQDAASDIDLLLVGSPDTAKLAMNISQMEKRLHREINYTVLAAKEFNRKLARKDPLLTDIWSGKRIELIAA